MGTLIQFFTIKNYQFKLKNYSFCFFSTFDHPPITNPANFTKQNIQLCQDALLEQLNIQLRQDALLVQLNIQLCQDALLVQLNIQLRQSLCFKFYLRHFHPNCIFLEFFPSAFLTIVLNNSKNQRIAVTKNVIHKKIWAKKIQTVLKFL